MSIYQRFRAYMSGLEPVMYQPSTEPERYAVQNDRNKRRLYAWELRFGLVKLERVL